MHGNLGERSHFHSVFTHTGNLVYHSLLIQRHLLPCFLLHPTALTHLGLLCITPTRRRRPMSGFPIRRRRGFGTPLLQIGSPWWDRMHSCCHESPSFPPTNAPRCVQSIDLDQSFSLQPSPLSPPKKGRSPGLYSVLATSYCDVPTISNSSPKSAFQSHPHLPVQVPYPQDDAVNLEGSWQASSPSHSSNPIQLYAKIPLLLRFSSHDCFPGAPTRPPYWQVLCVDTQDSPWTVNVAENPCRPPTPCMSKVSLSALSPPHPPHILSRHAFLAFCCADSLGCSDRYEHSTSILPELGPDGESVLIPLSFLSADAQPHSQSSRAPP